MKSDKKKKHWTLESTKSMDSSNEENKNKKNFEQCRACLKKSGDVSLMLESELENMFTFCTSIPIDKEDALPKHICSDCKTQLINANVFKIMCLDSHMDLLNPSAEPAVIHLISEDESSDDTLDIDDLMEVSYVEPFVAKPDNVEPFMAKPANVEPFVAKASNMEPIVAKPANTEPFVAKPAKPYLGRKRGPKKNESMFKCIECKETCRLERDLDLHDLAAHSDESGLKCPVCKSTFASTNLVKMHIRIHYKMPTFVCTICNQPFGYSATLRRHLRYVHAGNVHQCDYCKASFATINGQLQHIRNYCKYVEKRQRLI